MTQRIAGVLFLVLGPLSLMVAPLDAEGEEIVVTAQKRADYAPAPPPIPKPAVTVAKTADFLVQSIRLMNDSRDPTLREREVFESIEGLMKQAKARSGIELSYGEGFLRPIDLDDQELQLQSDYDRADSGFLDIYVKVRFDPAQDATAQIAALRDFIDEATWVGRTEIEMMGDIGLSMVNPERYRYEIITGIAAESRKVMESVGSDCRLAVSGLENRVQWERTSVSELTLYIPYEVQIGECAG